MSSFRVEAPGYSLKLAAGFGFGPGGASIARVKRQVERFLSLDHDATGWTERWRPYRTWAVVLLRYAGHREGVV